jgi:hypothetical protein
MMLTQDELKQILHYDPDTGIFKWRVARGRCAAGVKAGYKNNKGYILIRVRGKMLKAHRLAWLYMIGAWPTEMIDHANRDGADNRWINLRAATREQNHGNSRISARNTSGVRGVSWRSDVCRWEAAMRVNCRTIHLGIFDSKEDARAARVEAARKRWGEFASE